MTFRSGWMRGFGHNCKRPSKSRRRGGSTTRSIRLAGRPDGRALRFEPLESRLVLANVTIPPAFVIDHPSIVTLSASPVVVVSAGADYIQSAVSIDIGGPLGLLSLAPIQYGPFALSPALNRDPEFVAGTGGLRTDDLIPQDTHSDTFDFNAESAFVQTPEPNVDPNEYSLWIDGPSGTANTISPFFWQVTDGAQTLDAVEVQLTRNGTMVADFSAAAYGQLNYNALGPGSYTFTVSASDHGHVLTDSRSVTIDPGATNLPDVWIHEAGDALRTISFDDPGHWSLGHSPGSNDDVIISSPSIPVSVSKSPPDGSNIGPVSVHSLQVSGNVSVYFYTGLSVATNMSVANEAVVRVLSSNFDSELSVANLSIASGAGVQVDQLFTNHGLIQIDAGSFIGPMTNAADGTIQFSGGLIDGNGHDFVNRGHVIASRSSRIKSVAQLSGTIDIASGGDLSIDTSFDGVVRPLIIDNLQFTGNLKIQAEPTVLNTDLEIRNSADVLQIGSVSGPGILHNIGGVLKLVHGVVSAGIRNESTLDTDGSSIVISGPFVSTGLVRIKGGAFSVAHDFVNEGTIQLLPGNDSSFTSFTASVYQLTNNGTIYVAVDAPRADFTSANLINNGLIDVEGDSATGGNITNNGTVFIADGHKLLYSGTRYGDPTFSTFNHAGTLAGTGILALDEANLYLTNDLEYRIESAGGRVAGPGTLTNPENYTLNWTDSISGYESPAYIRIESPFVNRGTVISARLETTNTVLNVGDIEISGLVPDYYNLGTLAPENPATFLLTGSVVNQGTITITSTLFVSGIFGSFQNLSGAVLKVLAGPREPRNYSPATTFYLGGDLVNHGTLELGGDAPVNISLYTYGFLSEAIGSLTNASDGTVIVDGTDERVIHGAPLTPGAARFENDGVIQIIPGQTLKFADGGVLVEAGQLVGAGTLRFDSSTFDLVNNFTNTGIQLQLNQSSIVGSGTFINPVGATFTVNSGSYVHVTLDNQGTLNLNSTTLDHPVTNSGALDALSSTFNDDFTNAGTAIFEAGNFVYGSLVTSANSVVRLMASIRGGNSQLSTEGDFTNNGRIELTDDGVVGYGTQLIIGTNGPKTLTNSTTGTIDVLEGLGGFRYINAAIDNQGTLNVNTDLNLYLYGTTTPSDNSGTITIVSGHTLSVIGGVFNEEGVIGGGGTLNLPGTTFNLNDTLSTGALSLILTNTTVGGSGTLLNDSALPLTLRSVILNVPVTNEGTLNAVSSTFNDGLANDGTTIFEGGNTVYGALVSSHNSVLRLMASIRGGNSQLSTDSDFTNNGRIELTDDGVVNYGTQLIIGTSGSKTLTNSPTATIDVLQGLGGFRYINAALDNQGTLNVNTDLNLYLYGTTTPSNNSGTITIVSGHTFSIIGGLFNEEGIIGGGGVSLGEGNSLLESADGLPNSSPDSISIGRNSGIPTATNATIGGGGALHLYGTTFNLNGTLSTAEMPLIVEYSTIAGAAALLNDSDQPLTLTGATLNVPFTNEGTVNTTRSTFLNTFTSSGTVNSLQSTFNDDFTNAGTAIFEAGNTVYGSLVSGPNSVLRLMASLRGGNSQLTTEDDLVNNGRIELTDDGVVNYGTYLTIGVNGSKTLTNSPTGTIDVLQGLGGNRTINAAIDNQGELSISASTLNVSNLSMTSTGVLRIGLGENSIAAGYAPLVASGIVDLRGSLVVVLTNGYMPEPDSSFDFVRGNVNGEFATVELPAGGRTWNTSQLYVSGMATVGGMVGDYNYDGIVDAGDYIIWRRAVESSDLRADGNGNGSVGSEDNGLWRSNFGKSLAGGALNAVLDISARGTAAPAASDTDIGLFDARALAVNGADLNDNVQSMIATSGMNDVASVVADNAQTGLGRRQVTIHDAPPAASTASEIITAVLATRAGNAPVNYDQRDDALLALLGKRNSGLQQQAEDTCALVGDESIYHAMDNAFDAFGVTNDAVLSLV